MKFAFLTHPLSEESRRLFEMDPDGDLRASWGKDIVAFCRGIHRTVLDFQRNANSAPLANEVRVVDELGGLVSVCGARADGRLYEIPMHAMEILDEPDRALDYCLEAIEQAADWGARVVGLGSMTGVIGSQGDYLSQRATIPVTTGNSLTVFAALENLTHACREVGVELAQETVCVVGVPGSIATAAATVLAGRCRSLILVARQASGRAARVAEIIGGELSVDIRAALQRARIVVTATSSGDCIDQSWLLPGSIVVDVAIPTDVRGTSRQRNDVLVLSGGLARVPATASLESTYLWFHQGMIPSCLAETVVLALEDRRECFSLGRSLKRERIEEIGALARSHGFGFSRLFSFGLALDDAELVRFRKARALRVRTEGRNHSASPRAVKRPALADLAERASACYGRYVNPVLTGLGGTGGSTRTFVRGEGVYLWDREGRRYLDCVSGFGSLNLGHNHPTVVEAVSQALREAAPGFAQSAVNPYAAALAEALVTIAPPSLEMVFLANSGTEAVEAALKLARISTGRSGLLHCERSYHGKSMGSLSVTGNPIYQKPFAPLLPDCQAVPFGDLASLEQALSSRRFAAFVVEPIQGEAGMIVPPDGYLREAHRLCHRFGSLLAVDEVQTGLGRTGTMFAVEGEQVEPDIMTLAKSLGGGLVPIGAMLCRGDLWMKAYGTLHTFALHSSTFGGGSLACAAALAALDVLRSERLADNACVQGRTLQAALRELCAKHEILHEVRGRGLMLGLECRPSPASVVAYWRGAENSLSRYLVPDSDGMIENSPMLYLLQTLLDEYSIYAQATRSNPLVLRIQPPLTVTAEDLVGVVNAIDEACGVLHFINQMAGGVIAKSAFGQHQGNGRGHAHKNGKGSSNGKLVSNGTSLARP